MPVDFAWWDLLKDIDMRPSRAVGYDGGSLGRVVPCVWSKVGLRAGYGGGRFVVSLSCCGDIGRDGLTHGWSVDFARRLGGG